MRPIDADTLLRAMRRITGNSWEGVYEFASGSVHGFEAIANYINATPTLTRDDIIGTSEWILHRDGSATCRHCNRTALNAWDYDNWLRYCPSCGKRMASAVSDKGDCE